MRRPNILLLSTDQWRWDALGANGNPNVQTPNLDRLADEGTNFDHYFVQNPVCMPSRVSFLTGQYPSTLGITHMGVPVPAATVTLPTLLRPYGYTSANIGKLHFLPHANRDHREPHPSYGFDHLEVADEPGEVSAHPPRDPRQRRDSCRHIHRNSTAKARHPERSAAAKRRCARARHPERSAAAKRRCAVEGPRGR